MVNRLELRVDDSLKDAIEKYRFENGFEDRQDAIREILREKLLVKKGFFRTLFSIFKR